MTPTSGARSGTKPGRHDGRGAGTGKVMQTRKLACGHTIDRRLQPLATRHDGLGLYTCPHDCRLVWEAK